MSIGKISEFDLDHGNWSLYCERVELFFKANGIKNELKLPTLISLVGDKTYELMVNVTNPMKPAELEYERLVDMVRQHLQPTPTVVAERYRFRQRRQNPTESIAQFVTGLKQAARYCNFGTALEENLRDQLVCGLRSDMIRQRLFAEESLPFGKAMSLAQSLEMAEKDAASVEAQRGDRTENLAQIRTAAAGAANRRRQSGAGGAAGSVAARADVCCGVCGAQGHSGRDCRYSDYVCSRCKRPGHLRRVCRAPVRKRLSGQRANFISEGTSEGDAEQEVEEPMFQMSLSDYRPVSVVLLVNGKKLKMEVDTGTATSCISQSTYLKMFSDLPLKSCDLCFKFYDGSKVKPLGVIQPLVGYGNREKCLDLFVVKKGVTTLVGRQWLTELKIKIPVFSSHVENMCNISETAKSFKSLNVVLDSYKDVLAGGLGRYTGEAAHLVVRPDATPVYCRARPLPYALRERVDAELDAMLAAGVIEPIDCSAWAAPLVPVRKKDGGLRVCADFKVTLNPYLVVDRYPLPRIQDLFANLSGGEKFTKIDMSQAYNQICLSEDSKKYTVISTHRGLFRYNRLVYGLASSSGIFQRIINNLIKNIPNTQAFLDDVIITGPDDEAHLRTLETVLKKFQSHGLKIKRNKCTFLADEVNYLGYIVSKQGIRPDPTKINSIKKMPTPTNTSELRSFLGMVNFYAKFVRNLSHILHPLYELLKKGKTWIWSSACEKAFNQVKELLLGNKVLMHYDPKRELIVTCDASGRGIGGVLSQIDGGGAERPVAYVSRKLTDAEKSYAQIHREALAIVFTIKKFHEYLYGRRFLLRTDHKPLVSIFGPQKGIPPMAASKMQRWAVILSAYDFDIQYVRTDCNAADALSRLPSVAASDEQYTSDSDSHLFFASDALLLNNQNIKKFTKRDPILSRVYNYINTGWPSSMQTDGLQPYWNRREELYTEAGCVMWGYRVVVPTGCREQVLRELHEPHMGIVKTKAMARSYVWWPGVDEAIESQCKTCAICAECAAAPPAAPPSPWRWPQRPYERVHCDFLGPIDGNVYLITIDARSKWIEVFRMTRTTAQCTINKLRESWARWGLPKQVVTDNGPPFSSAEFNYFLEFNGIEHLYSPPYHPASNGAAENAVKIIKNVIKKARAGNNNIDTAIVRFLLNYHNTPHSTTGESPARLLQGRQLRTRLDALKPDIQLKVVQRQKQSVDKTHTQTRVLGAGEQILYRNYNNTGKWLPGQIANCLGSNTYSVTTPEGIVHHRHVDQLKRRSGRSSCIYPSIAKESYNEKEQVVTAGTTTPANIAIQERLGPDKLEDRQTTDLQAEKDTDKSTPAKQIQQPSASSVETQPTATTVDENQQEYVRPVRERKAVKRYGLEID